MGNTHVSPKSTQIPSPKVDDEDAGSATPRSLLFSRSDKSSNLRSADSSPPPTQKSIRSRYFTPKSMRLNSIRSKDAVVMKVSQKASRTLDSQNSSSAPKPLSTENSEEIVHHSACGPCAKSPAESAIEARTLAAAAAAERAALFGQSDQTRCTSVCANEPGIGSRDSSPSTPRTSDRLWDSVSTFSDKNPYDLSPVSLTTSPTNTVASSSQSEVIDPCRSSEHWLIDHSALKLGKTIGHSSFGTVNEGWLNGTKVAVKTIKRDPKNTVGDDIETFKKEAELNCKLRHPNIVLFMGISVQPTEVCIVTELMVRGNCHDLLVGSVNGKLVKLSWGLRLQWAIDTAQGMTYLHSLSPPIIHRDLKTTNLLVDRGMNLKICDFGLSRFRADDYLMSAVGTVQFAAPEVLRHDRYNEKADLFSYGTVLWELYTRKCVFKGMSQFDVYRAVVGGEMPEIPSDCNKKYAKLVRDCWQPDPSKRPTFRDVLDLLNPLYEEHPDSDKQL